MTYNKYNTDHKRHYKYYHYFTKSSWLLKQRWQPREERCETWDSMIANDHIYRTDSPGIYKHMIKALLNMMKVQDEGNPITAPPPLPSKLPFLLRVSCQICPEFHWWVFTRQFAFEVALSICTAVGGWWKMGRNVCEKHQTGMDVFFSTTLC